MVTSDEPSARHASLVAERLGLPHTPLGAVLTLQHKYYARQAFERIAPEANARTALIRRDFGRRGSPGDVPVPFPFYVKPAKAAFSVLARRVDSFEELFRHTRFGWFEAAIIDRLVRPFADVMRAHSALTEDPYSMVCEEILHGRQVTANGFARDGRVTMLGTVDSIMYPGTDQFQRFQYPSSLPADVLARVDALAARLVEGVGFTHGMFNVEMRIDPATGMTRVIEINPRAAGQFYDLFERVRRLAARSMRWSTCTAGGSRSLRHRGGRDRHAASFVLRDSRASGSGAGPSAAEVRALQRAIRDAHVMVYPKRGADLDREVKWSAAIATRCSTWARPARGAARSFRRPERAGLVPPARHIMEADEPPGAISGDD